MTIFNWVEVRDFAEAPFEKAWEAVKKFFSADVEPALKVFLQVLESNGGSALLQLALKVVTEAAGGVPFGTLIADLIAAAKVAGLEVTELAAKSALQVAQTSIQAQLKPGVPDETPNNSEAKTIDAPAEPTPTPAA